MAQNKKPQRRQPVPNHDPVNTVGRQDFFRGAGGEFNKGIKINSRSFIGMRRGSR